MMTDINPNLVTLPSMDIKRSIAFCRGMGFIMIVESPHYARFECPDGDATLSHERVDSRPAASGFTVYFESPNLDGFAEDEQIQEWIGLCEAITGALPAK